MTKFILSLATTVFVFGFTLSNDAESWSQWRDSSRSLVPASHNSQSQNASDPAAGSSLVVLSFKWNKSRQAVAKQAPITAAPAAAVTRADINFEKSKRANDPNPAATDPRSLSVDARSAALEKIVEESRSPGSKTVDGFDHRVKLRNTGSKVVEIVFWEYQFIESLNPENVIRRQFICGVEMKPNKEKEILAFSSTNPSAVISVESLANKSGNPYKEKVEINRVEYTDGSIWQRKEWNFAEMRSAISRAVATPWGTEMCRSL